MMKMTSIIVLISINLVAVVFARQSDKQNTNRAVPRNLSPKMKRTEYQMPLYAGYPTQAAASADYDDEDFENNDQVEEYRENRRIIEKLVQFGCRFLITFKDNNVVMPYVCDILPSTIYHK